MSRLYAAPLAGATEAGTRAIRMGVGIGLAVVVTSLLLLGCGSRPRPESPADATRALIAQAEAAEAERRYDRADALYLRARREAPDPHSRAAAALAHGRALAFWGQYGQAEAALAEAVRLQPDQPGAWHDLGMVRFQVGDAAGAEVALRRSIAVRPDDGRSRIALAALLWHQGRLGEALREYEALAALDALPARVRDQVAWAIATLRQRLRAAPPARSAPGRHPSPP